MAQRHASTHLRAPAEFEHGRSEQRRQRAMLRLYPNKAKRLGSALQNLEGDDPQAARRRLNAAGPPPPKIVSTEG